MAKLSAARPESAPDEAPVLTALLDEARKQIGVYIGKYERELSINTIAWHALTDIAGRRRLTKGEMRGIAARALAILKAGV